VNILPIDGRTCNFNCVYCQYGDGMPLRRPSPGHSFPSTENIARAVRSELEQGYGLDVITIAGNGEPTLHPEFPGVVDAMVAVRDRIAADVPIAILSNSSRAGVPEIRKALMRLDRRIMKLDAVDQDLFAGLNRAHAGQETRQIAQALRFLRPLIIQTLFISGRVDNSDDDHVDSLIEMYREIGPDEVQVYSTARDPAEPFVLPVSRARLGAIAARLRAAGIPARVYG
jgi:wyosine [tRNA(Phe)-imidazoG37] synthetase (radical SAM superfamily)